MYCIHFQILSARGSAAEQNEIFEFFKDLVDVLMESGDVNSRLDFLACPLSANNEGMQVVRNLEEFIKVWFLFSTVIVLSNFPEIANLVSRVSSLLNLSSGIQEAVRRFDWLWLRFAR